MNRTRKATLLLVLLASVLVTGCGKMRPPWEGTPGSPRVLVTFARRLRAAVVRLTKFDPALTEPRGLGLRTSERCTVTRGGGAPAVGARPR